MTLKINRVPDSLMAKYVPNLDGRKEGRKEGRTDERTDGRTVALLYPKQRTHRFVDVLQDIVDSYIGLVRSPTVVTVVGLK